MHEHLEIIIPRTNDVGAMIEQIMKPFCEYNEDRTGHEFWDFYVIGGRWAGTKETCGYAEERMEAFYKALQEHKVTVSSLQMGKKEISPASQIPLVDKLWNEFFPTEKGEIVACPLFRHSNNQFDSDDLLSCDICLVEEIPEKLESSRVIIAGPTYDDSGTEAKFMVCDSQWNGINHIPISWDGNVKTALRMYEEKLEHYKDEYKQKYLPKPNWLCITVDYHS